MKTIVLQDGETAFDIKKRLLSEPDSLSGILELISLVLKVMLAKFKGSDVPKKFFEWVDLWEFDLRNRSERIPVASSARKISSSLISGDDIVTDEKILSFFGDDCYAAYIFEEGSALLRRIGCAFFKGTLAGPAEQLTQQLRMVIRIYGEESDGTAYISSLRIGGMFFHPDFTPYIVQLLQLKEDWPERTLSSLLDLIVRPELSDGDDAGEPEET
ncbi:MAG: hypothetical protein HGA67_03225 [Candidatus Yonathbacteria bacterium]|nr:hypothetical protein [Candidatus Yonathbacteria bacterium]